MISSIALFALLIVSTYTDIRWRKIYNWNTYAGMLLALAFGAAVSLSQRLQPISSPANPNPITKWLTDCTLQESIAGLFSCALLMLVCYVFFAGGVGGGDVKMMAMIGAFLGVMQGLEALLWTLTLGGCVALISLVWKFGAWRLLVRVAVFARGMLRLGTFPIVTEEEREPLKADLFLSPCAFVGTILTQFRLLG